MPHFKMLPVLLTAGVLYGAGHLPFVFESNWGQAPADVQLLGRHGSTSLLLTRQEVRLHRNAAILRIQFEGRAGTLKAEGEESTGGVTNYYFGKTALQSPHFRRARYRQVYPGIDAVFYEKGG